MSSGSRPGATKKLLVFLGLCFGVSWAATLLGAAFMRLHRVEAAQVALLFMMAGPGLAGIVCAWVFERGRVKTALGLRLRPNAGWLVAFGTGVGFSAIAFAANIVAGGATAGTPPDPSEFALNALLINSLIEAALVTCAEEFGWRGYLYDLWRGFGFWRYSFATGLLWGIWHVPGIVLFDINYSGHSWLGAEYFVFLMILFAPLLTLARDWGQSVIAAGILHGVANATESAGLSIVKSASPLWQGDAGLGGLIAVSIGLILVILLRRSRLRGDSQYVERS